MEKYKNIHYNIELPIENEQYLSNKLIVFFMPADRMISTQAKLRMFGNSPLGHHLAILLPKQSLYHF
ncbi:hypothetical protein LMG8526HA_01310 [Lactococcus lactis]|uniref:hypothetical protein n=1 Tax=Lactococcus lactis TaxID=1358 RepID=UPI0028FDA124|nr:hypothetical protein [Lactococcus lactis]MDU0400426.1 hypothetical protein [Lactococcus lactis]